MAEHENIYFLDDYRDGREFRHLNDRALLSQLAMSERVLLDIEERALTVQEQHDNLKAEAERRGIGDALNFLEIVRPIPEDDPA